MRFCDYGCGQEATHQLKNGKWCCSENHRSCPELRRINGNSNRGKKRTKEFRNKMSKLMMGKNNHMFGTGGYWKGKKRSNEDIKKIKLSNKLTISQIQEKYLFFSKIEEMRYNPDKPKEKEIQVHCKNHNCKNSKEKNGWFTPVYIQFYERIRQLEKDYGNDGSYFYCSQHCKDTCPLYGLQSDPYKNNNLLYTPGEFQTFRNFVLERDNYICQFCGEKATHVHHERPQKLEPFYTLDPDYAWSCCEKCHYEKGHQDECSTGNLAKIVCRNRGDNYIYEEN